MYFGVTQMTRRISIFELLKTSRIAGSVTQVFFLIFWVGKNLMKNVSWFNRAGRTHGGHVFYYVESEFAGGMRMLGLSTSASAERNWH